MPERKCNQCGYKWTPRVKKPKLCPSCRKRTWDKPFGYAVQPYRGEYRGE